MADFTVPILVHKLNYSKGLTLRGPFNRCNLNSIVKFAGVTLQPIKVLLEGSDVYTDLFCMITPCPIWQTIPHLWLQDYLRIWNIRKIVFSEYKYVSQSSWLSGNLFLFHPSEALSTWYYGVINAFGAYENPEKEIALGVVHPVDGRLKNFGLPHYTFDSEKSLVGFVAENFSYHTTFNGLYLESMRSITPL